MVAKESKLLQIVVGATSSVLVIVLVGFWGLASGLASDKDVEAVDEKVIEQTRVHKEDMKEVTKLVSGLKDVVAERIGEAKAEVAGINAKLALLLEGYKKD